MSGFSAETTMVTVTVDIPVTTRNILVSVIVPQVYSSVTSDRFTIRLKEASTTIQQTYGAAIAHGWCGTVSKIKAAPAAGSVTYTATIQRDNGTGTLTLWSEGTSNIQLFVTLL